MKNENSEFAISKNIVVGIFSAIQQHSIPSIAISVAVLTYHFGDKLIHCAVELHY